MMLSLSKLNSAVNLPSSLVVRETNDQGRGVFTKLSIRRGKRIFASPPYSFGIGGITVENARVLCHHCLCKIRSGNPVVCRKCNVVGYCSQDCLTAALPLHQFECKGVAELEKLRKVPGQYITTERDDHRRFWPPNEAVMVARAINKKIIDSEQNNYCLSVYDLAPSVLMPALKHKAFDLLKKHVRYLVPSSVSDDEIYQTFLRTDNNSAIVKCPRGASAVATYLEYSLLNHMCKPNCGWEGECGNMSVYALEDIEPNSQLGISYLRFRYIINVREIRRKELKNKLGSDCTCFVCLEEENVGSKYWLLDQKKRSLIAPWSRKWADKMMEKSWEIFCQSGSMEHPQAIKVLEIALKQQVGVLDKVNVILILTAIFLLYKCRLVKEYKRGMSLFTLVGEEGMNALFEYGTLEEINFVGEEINTCCYELGDVKGSEEISDLMPKLFPKLPSADRLCDDWWDQGLKCDKLSQSEIKKYEDKMEASNVAGNVTSQQVSSCIAKLCRKISEGQY